MGRIRLSDLCDGYPRRSQEDTSLQSLQSRQSIQETWNSQVLEEETDDPTTMLQMLLRVPFGWSFSSETSKNETCQLPGLSSFLPVSYLP